MKVSTKKPNIVDASELLKFAVDYFNRYGIEPSTTFLSFHYDVAVQTIYAKLNLLEQQGKIKRVKRNTRFVAYHILKKGFK